MATLTRQKIVAAGTVVTPVAADVLGDKVLNDGRTVIEVTNGGGSPITVTINSVRVCERGVDHDAGGSVAAGATKRFGPFPKSWFDDSTGYVNWTYSAVTSVTVAAVQLSELGL